MPGQISMPAILTNSFRLIGTIIQPFKKVKKGVYTIYRTKIEVLSSDFSIQKIPLIFYVRQKRQIFDYTIDLTGKQVVVEGYIQGNEYSKEDGTQIDYIYIIARHIAVLSTNDHEGASAQGIVVDESDLPF